MKRFFAFFVGISALSLFAQEQAPSEAIEARPEGGFRKSIAGTWDCGAYGKMKLTDVNGRVRGTYSKNSGTVTGTVKNHVFSGDWQERKGGKKGYFSFEVSIRRMTPEPTNLEGTRSVAAKGARTVPWACSR